MQSISSLLPVSDEDLVPLTIIPDSQIRASSRVKKRPRVLDDYEVGI